jgi:hypothetical protein
LQATIEDKDKMIQLMKIHINALTTCNEHLTAAMKTILYGIILKGNGKDDEDKELNNQIEDSNDSNNADSNKSEEVTPDDPDSFNWKIGYEEVE